MIWMMKREQKSTQAGQGKENITETVIRKKENISENSDKKNISERMLKTMRKPNAPREGRGVPLQRQNLKNFLVS